MKLSIKVLFAVLGVTLTLQSCLDEDVVTNPTVQSAKFYTVDVSGQFTEVTQPKAGVNYIIGVTTTADICTVWPGGERVTVKKVGTQIDSLDINNNVLLSKSNMYSDYGLFGARGLATSLNSTIKGWIVAYKYPISGSYTLTVVVTNHGYDNSGYKQINVDFPVTIY